MISIKNTQRTIPIDIVTIKKDAQLILDTLDYSNFDVGIWFTTNQTIQRFNRDYRKKDKPTDILSFPYHHELRGGEPIRVQDEDDMNLGDLILSPAYIKQDAPRWEQTFEERLRILLVHGICHLLGYDHITDADYAVMHEQEEMLLKKLRKQ